MAEELLPTVIPGMVGLRHKNTGKITNHFPVDAREIMTISKGEYELLDNGAVEAARLNANPLKALQAAPELIAAEVTGIEGQVMVAMTPEQAEAWKKSANISGDKPVEGEGKEAEKAPAPKTPAKAADAK